MRVDILSLKKVEFEGDALSFNVKTRSGEITILDHHLPLISVLAKGNGVLTKKDGATQIFKINSGFLEMSEQNTLSVLVD